MRKYILSNQGHCQLFQRDDKKDGEQESVPRGHVFCHLPARVHPHRVSDVQKKLYIFQAEHLLKAFLHIRFNNFPFTVNSRVTSDNHDVIVDD